MIFAGPIMILMRCLVIRRYTVLALIPARGGSKGIPRKNILRVAGKPLIWYTIEAAKKSLLIDKLLVSSEDTEILDIARSYGADILRRPIELAMDDTPGIDPVIHAISCYPNYDLLVLLQPTSPLRLPEDIDRAIELCVRKRASSCASVKLAYESPYWMYRLDNANRLIPIIGGLVPDCRQNLPKCYILNGAIYISKITFLKKTKSLLNKNTLAYIMPEDRSLDIDTMADVEIMMSFLNRS